MATQRVIWTVLPNGVEGSTRRLSVVVSPRLEAAGPTPLSAFEDFAHWRSKTLTFALRFAPTPAGSATEITAMASAASPEQQALWDAAFTGAGVEGSGFTSNAGVIVHSYPVLNVLDYITGQYQKFAATPATASHFPTVGQLMGDDGLHQLAYGWSPRGGEGGTRPHAGDPPEANQLRKILDGKKHRAMPPAAPNPSLDFWQVKELYRPRTSTKTVDLPGGFKTQEHTRVFPHGTPVPKPAIDFHKAVALLANHPELMRALGLVVDLEVSDPVPSTGVVWVHEVEASPAWVLDPVDVRPKTWYTADFRAQSGSGDLSGGFLALGKDFALVEVDVDGAALKLVNLANTVAASLYEVHQTTDTPGRFSLPALRSAGLSLVRTGRATKLVQRFDQALKLNKEAVKASPTQPELHAEDLVRGYAVDVRDVTSTTKPWASLNRRRVSYELGSGGAKVAWPPDASKLEDEGWTTLAATSDADGKTSDLSLHESMFRWDGWSLSVRRPGKHIGTDDTPADFENEADPDLKVSIDVAVQPDSLPRLRFGRSYQLRARAVDLAGNRIEHDDAAPGPTIGPKDYLRFEPVIAPAVVFRKPPVEGESLERLVIRSHNDDQAKDSVPTTETTDRHIAPPLTSQLLAEAHGKFDAMAPAASYALVSAKQGTLEDPSDPGAKVAVHPEAQLALPYLPDPLSRGATFLGLPIHEVDLFLGLPGAPLNKEVDFRADGSKKVTDLSATEKPPITLVKVSFGKEQDWPELTPFRVHVVEGSGEPSWDKTARELTVEIPKAQIARLRLSSYIDPPFLSLLGIWRWIEERKPAVTAKVKERLRRLGVDGRHWMLTPFRELVIVHAVQQPFFAPDISALTVQRDFGSTAAELHGTFDVHAWSTGKLDYLATWEEPVDPIKDPKWKELDGSAHAFAVPVAYPKPLDPPIRPLTVAQRHEFGDTKHRLVRYKAVAVTRFREYFPPGELDVTRESEEVELHVPSSARPAAPRILYAVPTFGWQRGADAGGAKSNRSGGGLRVYLERPWFSSGDDELLGVVLPELPARRTGARTVGRRALALSVPDRLKPYVTQWGADPVAASPVPRALLRPADFKLAQASRGRLTLDEVPAKEYTVAVAGHKVRYDERRQLWYCDIELDPGPAYFPFVRLALARFQPYSVETPASGGKPIANVHLSRVVLAEFAQLAPNRSATVTFDSDTELRVAVAGTGVFGNVVEITVESQRPDLPTDLGWVLEDKAKVGELRTAGRRGLARRFTVTLPVPRGAKPLRLVIREHEELPTDPAGKTMERRLVYAEVLPL
jgi:hypothetical protein